MSSLVIVAIPAEDEVVYKVSSEKVPHLTLMYLGEASEEHNVLRMAEFVDHALTVNQHGPFHLSVDYRGELGADKADVVFFEGGWDTKWIKSLRSQLLKQSDIRAAYEAAETFPDWVPHLTLGYPDSPAKPLPNDYGKIYGVQFDRIAVWDGDYEGPEFRLRWPEREDFEDAAVAWSLSEAGEEFVIKHHGVKGMKWGVRKEELEGGGHIRVSNRTNRATISNSSVALYVAGAGVGAFVSPRFRREWSAANAHNKQDKTDKKLAKKDMKWEKQIYTVPGAVKVHNEMANHFNQKIEAINNKPAYKDINLHTNPDSPAAKKYLKEVNDLTMEGNRLAVQKVHGKSPSGKKEAYLTDNGQSIRIRDAEKKVEHAAEDDYTIEFRLRWDDETGKVLEMNTAEEESVTHEIERGREFLEHHGVKGMRWGVHRDDVETAANSSTSKLGAHIREANKFARDVEFESHTRPRKSEEGLEQDSVAKEKVAETAEKNFRGRDLPGIKSKPEYARAAKLRNRLLHPKDEMTKAYRKEVRETYIRRLESTANDMKNASGTREYTIREKGGDLPTSKYYWEVSSREAKHADGKDKPLLLEVLMDDDGFITGTKVVPDDIKQAMEFGEHILEHYGVKGMQWGVRKQENKNAPWLDPEGKDLTTDVVKSVLWPLVPPLGVFAIPAQIRLVRGGLRAGGAKIADMDEKRFAAHAQSQKNFAQIHNGAQKKINDGIADIDKKYPGDLTKNPTAKKRYDADVQKLMQESYRQSANAIGNKTSQRVHLDVEFKANGKDFSIKAAEGRPTSIQKARAQGIRHASDDIGEPEFEVTLTIDGTLERGPMGHISGFKFDGMEQAAAHALSTTELGAAFLEHYGVKGMQWGVRRRRGTPLAIDPTARSRVPHGSKRKTKIETEGGENHPATDDAIAVAQAHAKLKKSGPAALTNRELQQIASRIELEDRVTRATRSKGNKFVRELIEGETKSIAKEGFRTATGRQGGGGKDKKK